MRSLISRSISLASIAMGSYPAAHVGRKPAFERFAQPHHQDGGRRTLLPFADFAKIERLSEPTSRFADQQDRFVGSLEGKSCGSGVIVQKADAADRRSGENRASVGLVVERHVPRNDGKIECAT